MNDSTTEPRAETTRCVICRAGDSRRLFNASGYWIRQCQACGHQFAEIGATDQHVEAIYGDDYFSAGGAGYSDYLSEAELLVKRGKWYARRIARHAAPGTMLDVGAAAGLTLRGFAAEGWQGMGIEPNAKLAEYARTQLNVSVEAASLESWLGQQTFDLVSLLQVLPHFVDPRSAVAKAAELTRPGGHLLIETWDRNSWSAQLFGKSWHEYSPPSVVHWFSKPGLIRLLNDHGLALVDQGRPFKWISVAHARSVLQSKAQQSLSSRLMLTAAWPLPGQFAVPYLADDLFWMLFRRTTVSERANAEALPFAMAPSS